MIRLHCLHAHPSNISYIDDAFYDTGFDLHHIVDSSFMERAKQDPAFDLERDKPMLSTDSCKKKRLILFY